ncbi:MAG: hypothetical protein EOM20_09315 [Spartobacteria bacterium]|nr:hypothetical protein [Spartobacteria bacterium]
MAAQYLKKANGKIYGPVELDALVEWAGEGRVGAEDMLSEDRETWTAAVEVKELQMFWQIRLRDHTTIGPLNILAAYEHVSSGHIQADDVAVNTWTEEEMPVQQAILQALIRERVMYHQRQVKWEKRNQTLEARVQVLSKELRAERDKDSDRAGLEAEIEHLTGENDRLNQEVGRLIKLLNENPDTPDVAVELEVVKKENARLQDELRKIAVEMKTIRQQAIRASEDEGEPEGLSAKPDKIRQPFMKAVAKELRVKHAAARQTPPVSGLRKRTIKTSHPTITRHPHHGRGKY